MVANCRSRDRLAVADERVTSVHLALLVGHLSAFVFKFACRSLAKTSFAQSIDRRSHRRAQLPRRMDYFLEVSDRIWYVDEGNDRSRIANRPVVGG